MILLPLGKRNVIFKIIERIGARKNIENFASSIADTTPKGSPAIKVTKAAIKPSCMTNFLRFNKAITKLTHAKEATQLSR